MPSLSLTTKTLRYAVSDETVLKKAVALLGIMAEYDPAAKLDSGTGLVALRALLSHIQKLRGTK